MTTEEILKIIDDTIKEHEYTANMFRGSVHERLRLITYDNDIRVDVLRKLKEKIS